MQQLSHARGVSGVYVIVRVETGESYVGSSADIGQRWYHHRGRLRRGLHSNPRLQAAWSEHGEGAFRFVIVERLPDIADLRPREQAWLDASEAHVPGVGYNLSWSTNGVGWRYNDEQRARLSAALKGKPKSAAHRAALAARPVTEAQRASSRKGGAAGKGVPKSLEHRRKIGAPQRGSSNHQAKLTAEQVIEIRRLLAAGGTSKRAIAAQFGIAEVSVWRIDKGTRWGHLGSDG